MTTIRLALSNLLNSKGGGGDQSSEQIKDLREEIKGLAQSSKLNAYINDATEDEGRVFLETNDEHLIPIMIKDNICVKDSPLTCSSLMLKNYISPYDATVITRIKKSGLTPFGRGNMDEFAMGTFGKNSIYGATLNPFDLDRVAGGSSSGCASAVGGGIALAALASDTGGSIRAPAAHCGCVGFKPSYGAVSRYGLVSYASSLDQIGPITKSVEDAALLFNLIKGHDEKDLSTLKDFKDVTPFNVDRKFKVAVSESILKNASDEIAEAYIQTVELLQDLGHEIILEKSLDLRHHVATYYIIANAEASSNLARFDGIRYGYSSKNSIGSIEELYVKNRSEAFGDEVKKRILIGNFILSSSQYSSYYLKAKAIRQKIKREYEELFSRAECLLMPIIPTQAPLLTQELHSTDGYSLDVYGVGANLAGLPALSLPVCISRNNLPIGLQIMSKFKNEQAVFDLSFLLERELNLSKQLGKLAIATRI